MGRRMADDEKLVGEDADNSDNPSARRGGRGGRRPRGIPPPPYISPILHLARGGNVNGGT